MCVVYKIGINTKQDHKNRKNIQVAPWCIGYWCATRAWDFIPPSRVFLGSRLFDSRNFLIIARSWWRVSHRVNFKALALFSQATFYIQRQEVDYQKFSSKLQLILMIQRTSWQRTKNLFKGNMKMWEYVAKEVQTKVCPKRIKTDIKL